MCAQTHTHSNNTHNSDRDQSTPATVTLSQESPTVSLSSTATAATTGHFSDIVPYTDHHSTCRVSLALLPTMKLTFPPTAPATDSSSVASFVLCHITHTMRLAYSLASGVGFSLTGIRLRFSPCSLILSPFTHSPTTTTPGLTCPPAICTDISPIQPLMAVFYDSASDITQPISAGQISGENLSLPSSTVSCGGNEHDLAAAYPSVEPTSTDDGSTVTSATAVAVQPVTTAPSSFNESGSFIDLDSAVDPSSSHMSNTPSVITTMSTESGGLIPETANSAETRAVMIPSNHSSETVAPMIQSAYSAETCAQMVQSNHSAETCAPMIQSVITGAPIVTSNHSSETGTPMTHSVETGAVMVQVHSTESAETGVLMVPSVTSTEHRARADSGALTPDTHSENCAEIDSTEAGILFHSTTFPETVAPVTPTYSTHVYESVPSIRALVQTSANAGTTTSPTAHESLLLDPSHSSVAHTSSNQFTYSHRETVSPSVQSTSASLTEEKHSFTAQNTSSHVPTPPSSFSSPSYVSLTDFTGLGAGPEVMATEQLSSIPDPELEYCYSDISLHNPPSPCILYSPSCSVDSLVAVTSQYNPSTPQLCEPLFPAHSVPQLHRGTFTTTHSRSVPNLPLSNRVHQSPSLLLQHVLSHLFIFARGPESLAPGDTEEQVLIPRESVWASAAQLTHDIVLSSSESDHGEEEQGDGVDVGTAQVSNEKEYGVRNEDDTKNGGVDGESADEGDVEGESDDECDVGGETGDECDVDGETGDECDVDGETGDECDDDDVQQKDIGCLSMNKGKEGQGYGLDVDVDCKAQDFDVNKQQNHGTGGGLGGAGHSKDGESDGEDDDEYSGSDDADSSADDEYDHSQDDDSDGGNSDNSAEDEPPTPVYKTRSVRRSFTYLFVPSHSAPAALGAGPLTPLTTQPQNTKPQQTEV